MKKKLLSILLSLAMVVTMMPMMTGVAFAGTISKVSDILNTVEGGFPTGIDVPENAWTTEDGKKMFVYSLMGCFDIVTLDGSLNDISVSPLFKVTESGGNYVYTFETETAVFNMQDGKLVSIDYTDTKPSNAHLNGVYTAPVTHDLTVTKNGSAATEGEDYSWGGKQLTILKDGLTVSGTTNEEYIFVNSDVTDLTIKDLSITRSDQNLITFNGNATLTLVGDSILTQEGYGDPIYFQNCNGIIAGTGSVTASSAGSTGISGAALTFNQTGTVTAEGYRGIYATDSITFSDGIGEILARGYDTTYGAVYGAVTLGDALTMKGSTAYDTDKDNITGETTIDGNNVKTDDQVAKAVLIKSKIPTPAPTPDNTDKGVKTGDSSDIFFYGFTTLLALLGAGFVYGLRRKEEK